MKVYELIIPLDQDFRFEIVGDKLIPINERPIITTPSWWSKNKGYYQKPWAEIDKGVRVYRDFIIFPTFNVDKSEFHLLFEEWMPDFLDSYDEDYKRNLIVMKKDWIDHWEVGCALRNETAGKCIMDIPDLFR